MAERLVGIIGGSGLYGMEGFKIIEERRVSTPFGEPSDAVIIGELSGRRVAFMPRHGRGHLINPSKINYRANIFAMKSVGVEWLISVSAVGSLREEIVPGHLVIVDQFIDKTNGRTQSFYDDGVVVHVAFADPVCKELAGMLYESAKKLGVTVHNGGAYVCMEGPAFSTRAESHMHRAWGANVVGMTNMPEAKLAREAEICYSTIALATDYDCWRAGEHVSADMVVATVKKNIANAQRVLRDVIPNISADRKCACAHALQGAVQSDVSKVTPKTREKYAVLLGSVLGK